VASPPVEDWTDQVARQRALLQSARRVSTPGLDALHEWRDRTARAARVDPEAVLPDHVLARVAASKPRDLDELGALRGVGPILASRFGEAILDALGATADTNGTA
jgi:ribonuclease D